MLFDPLLDKNLIKNQLLQLCEGYKDTENYTASLSLRRKELIGWFEKTPLMKLRSFLVNLIKFKIKS